MGDEPLGLIAREAEQFLNKTLAVRLTTGQKIDGAEFRKSYPNQPEGFEVSTLQEVKVGISLSETLGWVNFPGPNGKIDYSTVRVTSLRRLTPSDCRNGEIRSA
jgi:hypothetical protein